MLSLLPAQKAWFSPIPVHVSSLPVMRYVSVILNLPIVPFEAFIVPLIFALLAYKSPLVVTPNFEPAVKHQPEIADEPPIALFSVVPVDINTDLSVPQVPLLRSFVPILNPPREPALLTIVPFKYTLSAYKP